MKTIIFHLNLLNARICVSKVWDSIMTKLKKARTKVRMSFLLFAIQISFNGSISCPQRNKSYSNICICWLHAKLHSKIASWHKPANSSYSSAFYAYAIISALFWHKNQKHEASTNPIPQYAFMSITPPSCATAAVNIFSAVFIWKELFMSRLNHLIIIGLIISNLLRYIKFSNDWSLACIAQFC